MEYVVEGVGDGGKTQNNLIRGGSFAREAFSWKGGIYGRRSRYRRCSVLEGFSISQYLCGGVGPVARNRFNYIFNQLSFPSKTRWWWRVYMYIIKIYIYYTLLYQSVPHNRYIYILFGSGILHTLSYIYIDI